MKTEVVENVVTALVVGYMTFVLAGCGYFLYIRFLSEVGYGG